jgi:hypothetical protein
MVDAGSTISLLWTTDGVISESGLVQEHIYAFYRNLLGTSALRVCGMSPLTWGVAGRVSEDENVQLTLTFSESDLAEIVKEMKTDTASEPDRCYFSNVAGLL